MYVCMYQDPAEKKPVYVLACAVVSWAIMNKCNYIVIIITSRGFQCSVWSKETCVLTPRQYHSRKHICAIRCLPQFPAVDAYINTTAYSAWYTHAFERLVFV